MVELALLSVFPGAMAFAGAHDLLTLTIPNRVSIGLIVAFFILAPFAGFGGIDVLHHVMAGLAMLAVGIVMFELGWLGGGDAKILACASLWLGFGFLPAYLVYTTLSGALLAVTVMIYRGMILPSFVYRWDWAVRLHERKAGIPYGIALGIGAFLVYPQTPWFTSLFG